MADEELERLRRRSESAIARARIANEQRPRDRLLSEADIDEVSGVTAALVEEHLKGAVASRDELPAGSVEVRAPWGVSLRGRAWAVALVVLAVATLVSALRMIHPAFR